MKHPRGGFRRPVLQPEAGALRARPSLHMQAGSRGPQPLKGATPVARQSRFHGVSRLDCGSEISWRSN